MFTRNNNRTDRAGVLPQQDRIDVNALLDAIRPSAEVPGPRDAFSGARSFTLMGGVQRHRVDGDTDTNSKTTRPGATIGHRVL